MNAVTEKPTNSNISLAPPPLSLLPVVGGSEVPESFEAGKAAFDAAMALHKAGKFNEAADGFMNAASTFGTDEADADSLASARKASYDNAASSWVSAGATEVAKKRLSAAKEQDAACAEAIDELLLDLE